MEHSSGKEPDGLNMLKGMIFGTLQTNLLQSFMFFNHYDKRANRPE
jgi:hypothetical protein